MRRAFGNLLERPPLQFRVLYGQFLLRGIDLESLSIETDASRLLGQFAGILIVFSVAQAMGFFYSADRRPRLTPAELAALEWVTEQHLFAIMILVVGLFAVVTWDSAFPDRRDAMVLTPLPVRPRTILAAKLAASGAILAVAILALNFASCAAVSFVMGGIPRFIPIFADFLFSMSAASAFLYGSVLTVQGFTALLPRHIFLRLSSLLQLAAFGIFPAAYFLQPTFATPNAMLIAKNHLAVAWSPACWFFALSNDLKGTLPAGLRWLAWRAWIGLGIALLGAASSLLLCYLHTMKKTVEEPDLVPGAGGLRWTPRLGGRLRSAILMFSVRSLARSRQHRLVLAFYLALFFAIGLSWLRGDLTAAALRPLPWGFLLSTLLMMCIAVYGLRRVFSLPISLTANWVWRIAQLYPPEEYIAGTRWSLMVLAMAPAWLVAAALSLAFRPLSNVAAHLVVLALFGCILAEIGLVGLYKIPFTCSFNPGKSNIQFVFWAFLVVFMAVGASGARFELQSFHHPLQYAGIIGVLAGAYVGLRIFNRREAKEAVLYYEELEDEVVTKLGLIIAPHSEMEQNSFAAPASGR
jgi:hypothetical protein